ncbi:MAG: hypothetical protein D3910_24340 [Candidatus Electrothrix sp. ATG2]|nr:hypothetical protein [Candidatus Electrothrix sp. ATG2]
MTETSFLIYYDNKIKKCATYFPGSFGFHGPAQRIICLFSRTENNVQALPFKEKKHIFHAGRQKIKV